MLQGVKFYKYHGTGNDFIMIDGRNNIQLSQQEIKNLCDRHFGIGSDGLLIVRENSQADFTMEFYNPDGSVASFCGNGARCIVKFANFLKIIDKKTVFQAKDGLHKAEIKENLVDLQMSDVQKVKEFDDLVYLHTGTHHVVKFVDNVDTINIMQEAPKIRYDERFAPEGTNVNFVEVCDNFIKIRTYEKGVEAETLSCGTGVTAVALATVKMKRINNGIIDVQAKGGNLKVSFDVNKLGFNNIHLIANAEAIFQGEIIV